MKRKYGTIETLVARLGRHVATPYEVRMTDQSTLKQKHQHNRGTGNTRYQRALENRQSHGLPQFKDYNTNPTDQRRRDFEAGKRVLRSAAIGATALTAAIVFRKDLSELTGGVFGDLMSVLGEAWENTGGGGEIGAAAMHAQVELAPPIDVPAPAIQQ